MQVWVRCYEELNDYLPASRRKRTFSAELGRDEPLSALLQWLGIPTEAVELALGEDGPVGLGYRPREGERVALYPVFESLDLGRLADRRGPRRRPCFAVPPELERLAGYLRLLGFDVVPVGPGSGKGGAGSPVLLSRDPARLQGVSRGYRVRSRRPRGQAEDVIRRFDLAGAARPLSRCLSCGRELPAGSETGTPCPGCGRQRRAGPRLARQRRVAEAILLQAAAGIGP